jgi:hypothetical protein
MLLRSGLEAHRKVVAVGFSLAAKRVSWDDGRAQQ